MKKVFSLLAVLALVCMATSAWAEAVLPQAKTAYAQFDQTVDINITVDLYELPATWSTNFYQTGTPTTATQIEFQINNDFSLGSSTEYKAQGNVFAKITTNLTSMSNSAKLYMYTDNMNNVTTGYKVYGNGNRRSETWPGTGKVKVCNGLIRKDGKATTDPGTTPSDFKDNGDYAPIAVQFLTAAGADASDNRYSKANYPDVFTQNGYKGLFNLIDASDTTETGGSLKDNTIIGKGGAGGGIWVGQSWYSGSDVVIAFFGAKFNYVASGDKYMTDTIKFEYAAE